MFLAFSYINSLFNAVNRAFVFQLGPNPLLPEDALAFLMFVKDNPNIPIQQLDLEVNRFYKTNI